MAFRTINIEDLEDREAFGAWGYCTLKVQRGEEILGVKLKITSVPQELVDRLRRRQPKPPSKTVMLDPNTPEGQAMGVTTRQKAIIPDYNDPVYSDQMEEYNINFRREIVGHGVGSQLKKTDGGIAQTPEEKYKVLEEKGISGIHFAEITQQILALTQWTDEERVNFLKPGSEQTTQK